MADKGVLEFENAVDAMDPMLVTDLLHKIWIFLEKDDLEITFPNAFSCSETFLVNIVTNINNLRSQSLMFDTKKFASKIFNELEKNKGIFRLAYYYENENMNNSHVVYKKIFTKKSDDNIVDLESPVMMSGDPGWNQEGGQPWLRSYSPAEKSSKSTASRDLNDKITCDTDAEMANLRTAHLPQKYIGGPVLKNSSDTMTNTSSTQSVHGGTTSTKPEENPYSLPHPTGYTKTHSAKSTKTQGTLKHGLVDSRKSRAKLSFHVNSLISKLTPQPNPDPGKQLAPKISLNPIIKKKSNSLANSLVQSTVVDSRFVADREGSNLEKQVPVKRSYTNEGSSRDDPKKQNLEVGKPDPQDLEQADCGIQGTKKKKSKKARQRSRERLAKLAQEEQDGLIQSAAVDSSSADHEGTGSGKPKSESQASVDESSPGSLHKQKLESLAKIPFNHGEAFSAGLSVAICSAPLSLTPQAANEILRKLEARIYKEALEATDASGPQFKNQPAYFKKCLNLWCMNYETLAWLKRAVAELSIPMKQRLIVRSQVTMQRLHCVLSVPGIWDDFGKLARMLCYQNPWAETERWLFYETKKQEDSMLLLISVPVITLPELVRRKCRLDFILGSVYVKFNGPGGAYVDDPPASIWQSPSLMKKVMRGEVVLPPMLTSTPLPAVQSQSKPSSDSGNEKK